MLSVPKSKHTMIKELSTEPHCVISGSRREADENFWMLDVLKMGPDVLARNVGKKLYHHSLRNNSEEGEFSKFHLFFVPVLTQAVRYHSGIAKV